MTVGLPSAGGSYPQAEYAPSSPEAQRGVQLSSSAGAQLASGGAAGGAAASGTTQLAEVAGSDAGAGRTQSLYGLGGQEDPLEGTWKVNPQPLLFFFFTLKPRVE